MKLIGTYVSHFVRRVAIPLKIYGIDFEQIDVSVATDQKVIRQHSKLARIPSLIMDDGDTLIDSDYILAEIDQMVDEAKRLRPLQTDNQRAYGQTLASLTGSLDKATAWFYEVHRRPKDLVWCEWADHLKSQLAGGVLQVEGHSKTFQNGSEFLFENRLTHADIAVGLAYPLAHLVSPDQVNDDSCPKLAALSNRMNQLDAFRTTSSQLG